VLIEFRKDNRTDAILQKSCVFEMYQYGYCCKVTDGLVMPANVCMSRRDIDRYGKVSDNGRICNSNSSTSK
jgi:hypothetical protein